MAQPKRFWRALLFIFLLAALCGSFAFPVVSLPVNAAPRMQATACLDTPISQWTFENVTTSSTGIGTFSSGPGLPTPSYAGGNPGQAISFDSWTASASVDTNDYVDFALPTLGRNAIKLSFDYRSTSTGPKFLEVHYSVDGGTSFTSLGTPSTLTQGTSFSSLSLDFNTTQAIENIDNVIFRIYGYSASGSSGTLRLDDVTFTGNCLNPAPPDTPTTPLSVVINEVAWSGTAASSTDEWFELYNTTASPINLAGWTLQADDENPNISLSGTINPGDYFVVARFAAVFSDLTPDLTYSSGSFSNDGEILYLLDPNGNQVDTANSDGGAWPAGSGSPTFASMERNGVVTDSGTAWFTYSGTTAVAHNRNGGDILGTPGQGNWITTVTITPSPTITRTPTPTSTPGLCGVGVTPSSIIINEIAWAGTAASTSDEWIELYNPTSNSINLNGWILKGLDGTPNIILPNYDLGPKQYYILERGDDDAISDVNANQIFTGEIGNSLETLQLYNFLGVCVDTANSNGGAWPAGSNSTYGSMERRGVVTDSDTAWITNVQSSTWLKHDARGTSSTSYLIHGTPGYDNWAYSVTPTASPVRTSTRQPTPTRTPTPPPPPPLLVINEFVPRPGHDWNNDGIVNVEDEYIEILNHGVVDVNLSGYSLDDEVNIGSAPYRLPSHVLRPGERIVFYGSETGLLLSDGGDGVRLLRPNGQLMDAYNYFVVGFPDQAFCRLPDNGGADDWNQNCYPTPGRQNSLSGNVPRPATGGAEELYCPIADTLPDAFARAECDPYGNNIWRAEYWDRTGWYGKRYLPESNGRWPVFAD